MADREKSLQQRTLGELAKSGKSVRIFITNGFQITGRITGFDQYCILVEKEHEDKVSLIFKSAISTIDM